MAEIQWEQDAPDWCDSGRAVEALTKDGEIKKGTLEAVDVLLVEDEIPIWAVVIGGVEISLWDFEEFRYL